MTFNKQDFTIYPENLLYVTSTSGVSANNSCVVPRGYWTDSDGQLSVASDNTTANIATVPLFTVRVSFALIFYHRL